MSSTEPQQLPAGDATATVVGGASGAIPALIGLAHADTTLGQAAVILAPTLALLIRSVWTSTVLELNFRTRRRWRTSAIEELTELIDSGELARAELMYMRQQRSQFQREIAQDHRRRLDRLLPAASED